MISAEVNVVRVRCQSETTVLEGSWTTGILGARLGQLSHSGFRNSGRTPMQVGRAVMMKDGGYCWSGCPP